MRIDPVPFVITLTLPPRELSPNARTHWRSKAKQTKRYRNEAAAACLVTSGMPRGLESVLVQATFFFKQRRNRDRDNLLASLKAAFDGIADAGVVTDDSVMVHLPVRMDYDADHPRVEIKMVEGAISGI